MIYSLKVTDPKMTSTPWWSEVETLSRVEKFEFSSGLNIIWGRNASGKSTILQLLAQWFHAFQGGRSLVTEDSIHKSRSPDRSSDFKSAILDGAEVKHDGKPVIYHDPGKRIGVSYGHFDDDFLEEGLASAFVRGSSGQMAIHTLKKSVKQKTEPKIQFNMKKEHVNSTWAGWIEDIEKMLAPNAPAGPQTMLMDEPDRSLDIDNASLLWKQIPKLVPEFQVVVATHSPFAVNVAGAQYIDLSPGYLEKCRALFEVIHG
jgi:predicted ATPase